MDACEVEYGSESKRKHRGRNNNASEGVDENVWKVHTVTKQNECAIEESSQEEERGKSPIQIFVRVL
jgi:hypothetical protein